MTFFKSQVHVIKSDDLQQSEHNQNTRFQSAILLGDASTALLESAQKAVCIAFSRRRACDVQQRSSGGSLVWDLVLVILQHVVGLAPVRDESIEELSMRFNLIERAQVQDQLLAHRGILFLPAAEETALYDFDHERRRLFLAHLRIKSASVNRTSVS